MKKNWILIMLADFKFKFNDHRKWYVMMQLLLYILNDAKTVRKMRYFKV